MPGVARIDVNGRVTRQILDPDQAAGAERRSASASTRSINAIRAANQDVPAGRITRGVSDSIVRVEGKIKDPMQFARIIVAQQGGAPIYLSQVADIIDGEKDQDSIARINGRPAITLDLQKAQDGNIVDTGRGIKEAIATLKPRLPADVELRVTQSGADDVEASVNRVKQTIIEGALLTVLIVFLFLHSWRSTVITGLTLPIAVIATFIAIYAFGFSLNFLTLMALSLCIGLLIDDAIVVRENIVRHLGMGKDHVTAAQEATDEIGLAVMATTFAIVAVFVPIAFMSGIIGRFFFQFGVTVAVAVLVSLFVSFTLDPMLSSVWRDPPGSRFRRAPWLGRFMDRFERGVEWLHAIYGRILEWALKPETRRIFIPAIGVWGAIRHLDWRCLKPRWATISNRGIVLWIAFLAFALSLPIAGFVGTEFVPEADQGFISLRLNTPVGSSLEYTDTKVRQVEALLKSFPEIALTMTTIGTDDGRNYARVNLKLVDRGGARRARKRKSSARSAAALKPIPGIEPALRIRPAGLGQPVGARSGDDDEADRRVCGEGREDPGHRGPRDLGKGQEPGAVDPAQQRRRRRPRHHRAAGRRDDAAAAWPATR